MAVEIISGSISMKVWDRVGIEFATLNFNLQSGTHRSVVRHISDFGNSMSFKYIIYILQSHGFLTFRFEVTKKEPGVTL